MIDAEVMRLRRLRNTALKARSLARQLDLSSSRRNSVFSRSAVSCWQIARIVTGRLRAHPYLNYQQGPSELSTLYGGLRAGVLAGSARYGQRNLRILSEELQNVAHELDDARALTWSAELSDTFGRSQNQIRRLIAETGIGVRKQEGARQAAAERNVMAPRAEARVSRAQDGSSNMAGNWPYLAF
jgi:hypothetical protein